MTAVATRPTIGAPLAARSTVRTALTLGRVEGRRLLRHPAYLAGIALSFVFLFVVREAVQGTPDVPFVVWTGLGLYPVAAGTFFATFAAALRSRRHGTDELYGTKPTPDVIRTVGHLVALAWAAGGGVVLLGLAAVYHRLWDGVMVPMPDGVVPIVPHIVELALGPVTVILFGVLAVAVARWIPSLLALPVAAVALLVHFVTGSWGLGGTFRWFLPITNHQTSAGWVQVTPSYGYDIVESFDRVALAWHDGYMLALATVLAAVALLRHGRTAGRLAVLAAGTGAAVLTGILQLP